MATNGYIKSLDGVRAFAILLVMSLHGEITTFGWIGVQLFFVLSGFLITGILWKDKADPGPLSFKLKKFWVRRTLRIFPLYFGFLLVTGVVYIFTHTPEGYWLYIPYLVTYTFNFTRSFAGWHWYPAFTHFWSLCIEEQFYLFFPLIILISPRWLIKVIMIGVIAAAPLVRYLLGEHFIARGFSGEPLSDIVYWHTLSHLDAFFMGGIIHVMSLERKVRRPHFLLMVSLAAVVAAGIWDYGFRRAQGSYITDLGYRIGQSEHYEYVWHYTLLNLFFSSLILVLVSEHMRGRFIRLRLFLQNKWLVNIGRVSYSMYIFHWLVWAFLFKPYFNPEHSVIKILLFLPYLATVYLLSEVSYRIYEVHFIKLKDRFFPRPDLGEKAAKPLAPAVK